MTIFAHWIEIIEKNKKKCVFEEKSSIVIMNTCVDIKMKKIVVHPSPSDINFPIILKFKKLFLVGTQ